MAEWERPVFEITERIAASIEPLIRRASDELYADLLETVQDYLKDNALYNIGSRLDAAERERRSQWERAEAAERRVTGLRLALMDIAVKAELAAKIVEVEGVSGGFSLLATVAREAIGQSGAQQPQASPGNRKDGEAQS